MEQFFSGGAYSIRGFTARTLGPGSFHEEENTYIDQSGDIKLEANLEFRFGISRITRGAVFMDVGNIWLHNEDENRPGSQFLFSTFYRQLAVGAGVGLGFDFNFLVLWPDSGSSYQIPCFTLLSVILFRVVYKDIFQGCFEDMRQAEGQFQGRGVVPLLNGHYGLAGYPCQVGKLLLRHLICMKAQFADIILYAACGHLKLLSCNNRSVNHCR